MGEVRFKHVIDFGEEGYLDLGFDASDHGDFKEYMRMGYTGSVEGGLGVGGGRVEEEVWVEGDEGGTCWRRAMSSARQFWRSVPVRVTQKRKARKARKARDW